jgi:hypothetical protein
MPYHKVVGASSLFYTRSAQIANTKAGAGASCRLQPSAYMRPS